MGTELYPGFSCFYKLWILRLQHIWPHSTCKGCFAPLTRLPSLTSTVIGQMNRNISLWKEPFWSQILANPSIIWTFFTASRIYCSKVICVVLPVPWQNHRVEFSDTTPSHVLQKHRSFLHDRTRSRGIPQLRHLEKFSQFFQA